MRIDKIKARLEAATPGPWMCGYTLNGTYPAIFAKGKNKPIAQRIDGMKSFNGGGTAEFIANAPSDIEYLLSENARLTETIGGILENQSQIIDKYNSAVQALDNIYDRTKPGGIKGGYPYGATTFLGLDVYKVILEWRGKQEGK